MNSNSFIKHAINNSILVCVGIGASLPLISTAQAQAKEEQFIPWPQGKLQFDLDTNTVKASSWCSDDIGDHSKLYVKLEILFDSVEGEFTDSKVIEFSTKTSRFSVRRTEFTARLSEDRTELFFSGSYDDGEGYTRIDEQYLTINQNQQVHGEINWEWQDEEYKCMGVDVVSGRLNF